MQRNKKKIKFPLNQVQNYCGYLCDLLSFLYSLLTTKMITIKLCMDVVCLVENEMFLNSCSDLLYNLQSYRYRREEISVQLHCAENTQRQTTKMAIF